MPFLSLGLLKDEREDVEREDSSSRENHRGNLPSFDSVASERVQRTGLNNGLPDTGVRPTQPSGKTEGAGLEGCPCTSSPAETGGNARLSTIESENANSHLSEAIEELRQKVSGKDLPVATVWGERRGASPIEYLTIADRQGVPTFGTFKFGYLPGRGLLYSVITHEVLMFAFFLLFTYGLPTPRSQRLLLKSNINDHTIFLPEVGGGKEGEKSPGGGVSAPKQASAAPAHASKGFAYPGSQPILSDPPNPTNAFQTVLRPLIVHPEPIKKLVPLPNIVQMAETRLPSDLIAPKAATPHLQVAPKPIKVKQDTNAHRSAKFQVPVNDAPQLVAKAEMPKLPAAEAPLPQAPKVEPKQEEEQREVEKPSPKPLKVTSEKRAEKSEKQAAPLSPAQVARMEMHGKALEPLVSLSPMPLAPGTNAKVPAGEARGRFAIAPGGTLNPNVLTPGKPNGTPSTSPATGNENSHAANAATEVASNAGTGAGHNAALGGGSGNGKDATGGGSSGTGTGTGNTSGEGTGGAGSGSGKGRGSTGKGAGNAAGRGAGTGAGAGNGSGSGSFPGITIQGGENDNASGNSPSFTIAPQQPYGMTVVSTASSGGGLEDYGVFENERVFTVYIPMKRTPDAEDPTWTLQYALLDSSGSGGDPQVASPFPVMREWPQLPAELEKKYAQRQVVINAVVDKEGKVSHILVKQTPDPRVSEPIVQALAKWVFRPAQLNNQPVAVKILLGIPL